MASEKSQQSDVPTKQVPGEDILKLPSSPREESHLMGSKCASCGEVMFGPHNMCLKCGSREVSALPLSRKGKIHSFTAIMHPPPECEIPVPYGSGYVELPEGVLVPTLLTESDVNTLQIGMEAEMVIEEFKQDEEGNKIVTYKFKPVHEG